MDSEIFSLAATTNRLLETVVEPRLMEDAPIEACEEIQGIKKLVNQIITGKNPGILDALEAMQKVYGWHSHTKLKGDKTRVRLHQEAIYRRRRHESQSFDSYASETLNSTETMSEQTQMG
jgi:hypothetical protein